MPKVQADGLPLPQRYSAILTIVIGISMAVLDGAIANVALPTIATDLHATPASSIWVVNAFSDSLQMLTLARVIQGFGGAALMSVNTALIRLIYPQRFLGRGMGINSFIVAVSSAAGPTIAAAILSIASWKWLFLINVPLGIIALLLAMRFLPPNGSRASKPRFDLPSAVMNALTFGLLITALSGFAQTLIAAETGCNGCCWYFLYSPPAFSYRTAATGGFTAYPAVFTFYLHICLLFLRTNAGNGFPALLPANRARA